MAEKGEALYRANQSHWDAVLVSSINQFAADARAADKPLVTTECRSVVNCKDYLCSTGIG